MGYYVIGFIVAGEHSQQIVDVHSRLRAVSLEQGFALFPLTEEIIGSVVALPQPEPLPKFEYLTEDLSALLGSISMLCPLLYFEAEYFGGGGAQIAMVLDNGNMVLGPKYETTEGKSGQSPISAALQVLGVKKQSRDFDEFDSVGLGRYRDNEDWLSSTR